MIANLSVKEMIEKALTTSCAEEISYLVKSPYMLVRRAIARNSHTPAAAINRLSMDPVLNVSYVANMNPKSSVARKFEQSKVPPCVSCQNKESELKCLSGCLRKEDHSF